MEMLIRILSRLRSYFVLTLYLIDDIIHSSLKLWLLGHERTVMSEVEDQIAERAGNLWAVIIERAKDDLISECDRTVLTAARYFFLEPVRKKDYSDIQTFAGLCAVIRVDADVAARAVFRGLEVRQRARILFLLRSAGFGKPQL